jgi:membrane protein implicated in regulation of membrane protease activity
MPEVVTFLESLTYWHWFALGAGLLILEIMTPTFYLIWPGIAAVVVGTILLFVPDIGWELSFAIFGFVSLATMIVWNGAFRQAGTGEVEDTSLNQRARRYVGRRVVVAEAFRGGAGPIFLDDTRWQAINETGTDLGPGALVQIVGADGAVLLVRPV